MFFLSGRLRQVLLLFHHYSANIFSPKKSCLHILSAAFFYEECSGSICRVIDWPGGYKTFSCSTQLSMKFILLINVKMSTIVDILTFISRITTTSERLKAINFFICRYFSFNEQLFCAQLS